VAREQYVITNKRGPTLAKVWKRDGEINLVRSKVALDGDMKASRR
jgi:hypothetical protein